MIRVQQLNLPVRVKRIEEFSLELRVQFSKGEPLIVFEFSEPIILEPSTFDRINNVVSMFKTFDKNSPEKLNRTFTKMMRTMLLHGVARFEDEYTEEVDLFVRDDQMLRYEDKIFKVVEQEIC